MMRIHVSTIFEKFILYNIFLLCFHINVKNNFLPVFSSTINDQVHKQASR